MKKYAALAAMVALTACASQRHTWVNPQAVQDPQRYEADYNECMSSAVDEVKRLLAYPTKPPGEQLTEMGHAHLRACLQARGYQTIR